MEEQPLEEQPGQEVTPPTLAKNLKKILIAGVIFIALIVVGYWYFNGAQLQTDVLNVQEVANQFTATNKTAVLAGEPTPCTDISCSGLVEGVRGIDVALTGVAMDVAVRRGSGLAYDDVIFSLHQGVIIAKCIDTSCNMAGQNMVLGETKRIAGTGTGPAPAGRILGPKAAATTPIDPIALAVGQEELFFIHQGSAGEFQVMMLELVETGVPRFGLSLTPGQMQSIVTVSNGDLTAALQGGGDAYSAHIPSGRSVEMITDVVYRSDADSLILSLTDDNGDTYILEYTIAQVLTKIMGPTGAGRSTPLVNRAPGDIVEMKLNNSFGRTTLYTLEQAFGAAAELHAACITQTSDCLSVFNDSGAQTLSSNNSRRITTFNQTAFANHDFRGMVVDDKGNIILGSDRRNQSGNSAGEVVEVSLHVLCTDGNNFFLDDVPGQFDNGLNCDLLGNTANQAIGSYRVGPGHLHGSILSSPGNLLLGMGAMNKIVLNEGSNDRRNGLLVAQMANPNYAGPHEVLALKPTGTGVISYRLDPVIGGGSGVAAFGSQAGIRDTRLNTVASMSYDAQGDLTVLDSEKEKIIHLGETGKTVLISSQAEKLRGLLEFPRTFTLPDSYNLSLVKRKLGIGGSGSQKLAFDGPTEIAVSTAGSTLYNHSDYLMELTTNTLTRLLQSTNIATNKLTDIVFDEINNEHILVANIGIASGPKVYSLSTAPGSTLVEVGPSRPTELPLSVANTRIVNITKRNSSNNRVYYAAEVGQDTWILSDDLAGSRSDILMCTTSTCPTEPGLGVARGAAAIKIAKGKFCNVALDDTNKLLYFTTKNAAGAAQPCKNLYAINISGLLAQVDSTFTIAGAGVVTNDLALPIAFSSNQVIKLLETTSTTKEITALAVHPITGNPTIAIKDTVDFHSSSKIVALDPLAPPLVEVRASIFFPHEQMLRNQNGVNTAFTTANKSNYPTRLDGSSLVLKDSNGIEIARQNFTADNVLSFLTESTPGDPATGRIDVNFGNRQSGETFTTELVRGASPLVNHVTSIDIYRGLTLEQTLQQDPTENFTHTYILTPGGIYNTEFLLFPKAGFEFGLSIDGQRISATQAATLDGKTISLTSLQTPGNSFTLTLQAPLTFPMIVAASEQVASEMYNIELPGINNLFPGKEFANLTQIDNFPVNTQTPPSTQNSNANVEATSGSHETWVVNLVTPATTQAPTTTTTSTTTTQAPTPTQIDSFTRNPLTGNITVTWAGGATADPINIVHQGTNNMVAQAFDFQRTPSTAFTSPVIINSMMGVGTFEATATFGGQVIRSSNTITITPLAQPPAPQNLTVTPGPSTGEYTISWDPIIGATGYDIQILGAGSGETYISSNEITGTSHTIHEVASGVFEASGVAPGIWTVTVRSLTPLLSEESTTSLNIGSGAVPGSPSDPITISNFQLNNGVYTAEASWQAILNYGYSISPATHPTAVINGGSEQMSFVNPNPPAQLSGLLPGTRYILSLRATNTFGTSPPLAQNFTTPGTPPLKTPNPPANIQVYSRNNSVYVTWQNNPVEISPEHIHQIQIFNQSNPNTPVSTQFALPGMPGTTQSVAFQNVGTGTYIATVAAINDTGSSIPYVLSTGKTYSVSAPAANNYADGPPATQLTNGLIRENIFNGTGGPTEASVGWNRINPTITIDLGETCTISGARFYAGGANGSSNNGGIAFPQSVRVSGTPDDINSLNPVITELGLFGTNPSWQNLDGWQTLSFNSPTLNHQYVEFEVEQRDSWIMLGEIEVLGDPASCSNYTPGPNASATVGSAPTTTTTAAPTTTTTAAPTTTTTATPTTTTTATPTTTTNAEPPSLTLEDPVVDTPPILRVTIDGPGAVLLPPQSEYQPIITVLVAGQQNVIRNANSTQFTMENLSPGTATVVLEFPPDSRMHGFYPGSDTVIPGLTFSNNTTTDISFTLEVLSPPTNIRPNTIGNPQTGPNNLAFTWDPPTAPGVNILRANIFRTDANPPPAGNFALPNQEPPTQISGLQPNTAYMLEATSQATVDLLTMVPGGSRPTPRSVTFTSQRSAPTPLSTPPHPLPGPPSPIVLSDPTSNGLTTLSWSSVQATPEINTYQIQIATNESFFNQQTIVQQAGPSSFNIPITNLNPFTTYYLRIRSQNTVGIGDPSTPVSFTTLPSAPSAASARLVNSSTIRVTWNESPGALSYNLYQIVNGAPALIQQGLVGTRAEVTNLPATTMQEFLVAAAADLSGTEESTNPMATASATTPAAAIHNLVFCRATVGANEAPTISSRTRPCQRYQQVSLDIQLAQTQPGQLNGRNTSFQRAGNRNRLTILQNLPPNILVQLTANLRGSNLPLPTFTTQVDGQLSQPSTQFFSVAMPRRSTQLTYNCTPNSSIFLALLRQVPSGPIFYQANSQICPASGIYTYFLNDTHGNANFIANITQAAQATVTTATASFNTNNAFQEVLNSAWVRDENPNFEVSVIGNQVSTNNLFLSLGNLGIYLLDVTTTNGTSSIRIALPTPPVAVGDSANSSNAVAVVPPSSSVLINLSGVPSVAMAISVANPSGIGGLISPSALSAAIIPQPGATPISCTAANNTLFFMCSLVGINPIQATVRISPGINSQSLLQTTEVPLATLIGTQNLSGVLTATVEMQLNPAPLLQAVSTQEQSVIVNLIQRLLNVITGPLAEFINRLYTQGYIPPSL